MKRASDRASVQAAIPAEEAAELRRVGPHRRKRTWRRPAAALRAGVPSGLGDLFVSRGTPTALWVVVAVSLAAHAAVLPAVLASREGDNLEESAQRQDTYLSKILEKENAKKVAGQVAHRVTMPPPPPNPEAVVEHALSDSLTSDVTKITAGLLTLELQGQVKEYVKRNLKEELDAASKNIATGKLSQEEIEALHKEFQRKAHQATLDWRDEYLKEHQVERAAMSTTEWYEQDVSPTLLGNISFELFRPPDYNSHPPSPETWFGVFTGVYGWGRELNWSDLRSDGMLREKLDALRRVLTGRWHNAGGEGKDQHPAWPGPSREQAQIVLNILKQVHDGRATETYPAPSWEAVVYGASARPMMTAGILKEFHPQQLEECRDKYAKPCDALWAKALAAGEEYLQKAQGGAPEADLKGVQGQVLSAVTELVDTAGKLLVAKPDEYRQANWALRLDVLTGALRDALYKDWVDKMVAGLEPLVRDFARAQFKKGIIVHKDGVDEAMKEFPEKVVPLLRRDVMRLFREERFRQRVHDTVYAFRGYASKVTERQRLPDANDVKNELAEMGRNVEKWPADQKGYVAARRALLEQDFRVAVQSVVEAVLERVFAGNLLYKRMHTFVEGVDYADHVQEKLTAREMAMSGRGQDLARLTAEGVPDTSAPLVALMLGASKGHGANLEPVLTTVQPAMLTPASPRAAIAAGHPLYPKRPTGYKLEEQANDIKPSFGNSPRFEAIPFLSKFPRLDGDLSDWGRIRPLALTGRGGEAILVYAAWNYQGFFFGCSVKEPPELFFWPSQYTTAFSTHSYVLGASMAMDTGVGWAYRGDYFRLVFDTLDARSRTRGDPHTQEFVLFPQGTESDPGMPGMERVIKSKRDAAAKDYRGVIASCKTFPKQPPPSIGPDGSGPYRVTLPRPDGYTMEVFLPRSLFNQPVFCPGWYVGFDCAVALGAQPGNNQLKGQAWAGAHVDNPDRWGDLLLLGTDPFVTVQEADGSSKPAVATSIIPGQSYLVTVIDPDRNINPGEIDSVIVSAEVKGGNGDVEVFVLNETDKNTGIFRGYIDTQPGIGRQVQAVVEVLPLQELRLGYVDVGDSQGRRNVINEVRLPVVAPTMDMAAGAPLVNGSR